MELKRYPDTVRLVNGRFAVSADFILREGKYDSFRPHELSEADSFSYIADTKGEGTYATNYRDILKKIILRAENDDVINDLRSKEGWDSSERQIWETALSAIVSEEHAKNALLGAYRKTNLPEKDGSLVPYDLNNVENYRYVCTEMAITESMLLQQAESTLLENKGGEGFKRIGQYFIVPGDLLWDEEGNPHAWAVSSLTGNIIETTDINKNEGLPYTANLSSDYTFDHMLAGYPAITTWQTIFTYPGRSFGQDTELLKGSEAFAIYTTQYDVAQSRLGQIPERLRLLRLGQYENAQFTAPDTWYKLVADNKPAVEADRAAHQITERSCVDDCDWKIIQDKLKEAGLTIHALDETIQNDEKPQILPLPERNDHTKNR